MTKVTLIRKTAIPVALLILCAGQALPAADRITRPIDNNRRAELSDHVNPRIQSSIDQGRLDPSTVLAYVTLVLQPSPAQQADLDQLLAQQQDPASPNYHSWLTPEQFADRFGASQADIDKIVAWLGQQQLTVKSVARGRNAIHFGGAARRIEAAFATEMHQYLSGGELHVANATNPSIPAALQGVVGTIHGLHDFRMRSMRKRSAHPHYNAFDGEHQLGPGDIATIYDITPLYNKNINGSGQKLVVAGDVEIQLADIQQYRSFFGLPANNPQLMLVPGTTNPGTCNVNDASCDLDEADLDLELSGAVARNATILFVYTGDVMNAVQYAIEQNLAPVISLSYGSCEHETPRADANTFESWAAQASAQGITWFAASGDDGAADCFDPTLKVPDGTQSVDLPAAVPQVTGIGGTEFNEGSGSYWNARNSATNSSALSYIPETSWNDSLADGTPAASGGGASVYFTKPSWQTGTGVPNDGARDVPDVSLAASPDHDGYQTVSGGVTSVIGGTSVGPPQFAGIATLLNQYLVSNGIQSSAGLGNMNPGLYALASVTGVFHDITTGTNIVTPCNAPTTCVPIGYHAGVGYDLVTGLGTVDVYNLVTSWHNSSVLGKGAVTMTLSASAASVTFSGTTTLTAAVTSADGGTPTGTVAFSLGNYSLGGATLAASSKGTAVASLKLSGIQLAVGANTISALYDGDASYNGATATASVTETTPASGAPSVKNMTNGASFTAAVAPGGILTIFGQQLASATGGALGTPLPTMLAGTVVTINGIAAPLYYISPTQLNVQMPYEVPPSTPSTSAIVRVGNNGESVFANVSVSADAPAIFTFANGAPVPFTTAARGEVVTLYLTGVGAVSPSVATGATPAASTPVSDLPAPVGAAKLTVGGVTAAIDFIGIPTWSVGVVQVNYTIPATAPLGAQPVVMSIGGVPSATTTLTVTP
ncbi:MAG TPA: protease pro-enzyme activation domain-containing protein [Bryobacteraceae bacterium]|nr:protease pro-enzyme activation domain-containing protein [Bryobacteraceae bacterium]